MVAWASCNAAPRRSSSAANTCDSEGERLTLLGWPCHLLQDLADRLGCDASSGNIYLALYIYNDVYFR